MEAQVRALRDLLQGPSSYLVMVGNNAEMRAGAGMPLQVGVAAIGKGDIELSDFKAATSELFTTHPTGRYNAHIPPELSRTYPNWLLGEDFPETAVIPDFPRTAPIFADIAADTQGWMTDGAIDIDAIALADLLRVVGPIDLYGVEYTAKTAPQLVLNQVYLAYDESGADARRDAQSKLAQALFDAIQSRDVDLLGPRRRPPDRGRGPPPHGLVARSGARGPVLLVRCRRRHQSRSRPSCRSRTRRPTSSTGTSSPRSTSPRCLPTTGGRSP